MTGKSCCRRPSPIPHARDFCANLTMATPVLLEGSQTGLTITVLTPGAQRMPLATALATFQCKPDVTTGAKLATLLLRAVDRVVAKGRASSAPVGRSMPMLMMKDALLKLADPCTACRGSGCAVCNGVGFPA